MPLKAVLRHVVLHPGAKIVNAWRDALLALARHAGTTMTKNEARARIDSVGPAPAVRRLRTWGSFHSRFSAPGPEITPEV